MSIAPRGMSVQEAYRIYRDGSFIINRKYQRKLIWTVEEKEHLIDSLLKDYPVPLILLAENKTSQGVSYEIIDGLQRLNAIFSFIEHGYAYQGQYFDLKQFARAQQAADAKVFIEQGGDKKRLSAKDCADILDYQLAVTAFAGGNSKQITDVFGRINASGKQLSFQEKRQAGMVNEFAQLVRKIAAEIRGDASRESLPLYEMPEISIDSDRERLGYGLKADEIFWCKQGILWKSQLKNSVDEEIIADISASILLKRPLERSRAALDDVYDVGHDDYKAVEQALLGYGPDRLVNEIKVVFSVLRENIESYSQGANALRSVLNPGSTNPTTNSFFALFMAFYKLIIIDSMSPNDVQGMMKAIEKLHLEISSTGKTYKAEDRQRNIDKTVGLIQKFFIKKDPPLLRHGAGLALDIENSLRRSRIETARYECKQGLMDLAKREMNQALLSKIMETICGIANVGPEGDGYIFIGVADKSDDAERIKTLDGVDYFKVNERYVVGIDREAKLLGWDQERYVKNIISKISESRLSDPLKTQVLTQVDCAVYKAMSIIRIRIPAQKGVSFFDNKAFLREGSSTKEVSGPALLALKDLFDTKG